MMVVLIMIICHNVYYRDLPWFAFVHMLKTNERWKRETRKGRREKLKEREEGKKRKKRNDDKNERSRCKTNYNTCCVPPVA